MNIEEHEPVSNTYELKLRSEIPMTEELKLCEHNNYHCYRCEVKLLKFTIDELQQQNKQLIEALTSVATMEAGPNNWGIALGIMKVQAQIALQQIQGKDG